MWKYVISVAVSWVISWVVVFHFGVRFSSYFGDFIMDGNSSVIYLLLLFGTIGLLTTGPITFLWSVIVGESVINSPCAKDTKTMGTTIKCAAGCGADVLVAPGNEGFDHLCEACANPGQFHPSEQAEGQRLNEAQARIAAHSQQ